MMLRRAAAVVLLACALTGLTAPMPALAAFFSRPNASLPVQTATLQPPTGVNVAFNCVANGSITVTWTASGTATTIGSRAANGGYTVAVTKSLLGFLPTTTNYTVATVVPEGRGVGDLPGQLDQHHGAEDGLLTRFQSAGASR